MFQKESNTRFKYQSEINYSEHFCRIFFSKKFLEGVLKNMNKSLFKSFLVVSCLVLFGATLSIVFINASPVLSGADGGDDVGHTATITVFDHYNSNWNHPAITTINIPCYWQVLSCHLDYDGYCDPNDPYLRAITFWLDWRGGAIGTYRVGPGQVRGYGTISPGQTKHWEFDMSNCQFASNTTGDVYWNFIPQDEDDIRGYFSPGEHTVTAFISSQDAFMGATQDSWISITLHIEYNDLIGDTLDEISRNLDDIKGLINEKLSGWSKTTCEKYLRFAKETVDDMTETHLNGELINTEELCLLKMRFIVIDLVADDEEISSLCDNVMNLIDDLINFIC